MTFSVIINCYNTLNLIKQCVAAAIDSTDKKTEIILVNNHPPYSDALRFLKKYRHPRVRVLDPGKNIGCMPGFQFGAEHSRGQYIIKLDDDVIVPHKDWIQAMYQALNDYPKLAYVALKPMAVKSKRRQLAVKRSYSLEFRNETILFWCMMIKKSLWRSHFVMKNLPLYGVGERYYERKANQIGLKKAYLVSHVCTSLGRTKESDPLYGAWKLFYVKMKDRRAEFEEWKQFFAIGPEEAEIMRRFGYPEQQITEIRDLLCNLQLELSTPQPDSPGRIEGRK
ncbi:MAG: glycosyltransferase family 2 protein [Firmicutes bacterium]|nr:glycosyltransferase family 2 protein [Bacillota bacterium]